MKALSPTQLRFLRARAHDLHPVVMIGAKGLTETVLREIESALDSHELIKIKDSSGDQTLRQARLKSICDTTACQPVQSVGNMLIVFRRAASPKFELPR